MVRRCCRIFFCFQVFSVPVTIASGRQHVQLVGARASYVEVDMAQRPPVKRKGDASDFSDYVIFCAVLQLSAAG